MAEQQSFLSYLETPYLITMRREMSPNPHDGTSYAHVVALLRSLISRELASPERAERDAAAAERHATEAAQQEAERLASRQALEAGSLPLLPEEAIAKAKADLEAKHERERIELARQQEADALTRQQVEEARQFAERQAQQRAELDAKFAQAHPQPASEPAPVTVESEAAATGDDDDHTRSRRRR